MEPQGECWRWTQRPNKDGYGRLSLPGRRGGSVAAYRFSYEYHRAEIPEGLHLDHLCRNPICVNPWHLEPVTLEENNRRKWRHVTHCVAGHAFNEENTDYDRGKRRCKECGRRRSREYARMKRNGPEALRERLGL